MVSSPLPAMLKTFLITQCIQNDFIRPLEATAPLPNLVHVGHSEAERLAGPTGALVPFLEAAHDASPEDLGILHLVDAHDPVRHAAHFSIFRPHCIQGSPGAGLIQPVDQMASHRLHTEIVRGGDLNDFGDSNLPAVLSRLSRGALPEELSVGVIGVWTDVKVAFLFYELATRLRVGRLATCSALTASRSMDAHFRALEQLTAVLGIQVLHSPNSFLTWLLGERAKPVLPRGPAARVRFYGAQPSGVPCIDGAPPPAPAGWGAEQGAERDALIGRHAGEDVELSLLHGGYSGSQVFVARRDGTDAHVLKIGPRDEIARERFGNERVRRVLGNFVPHMIGYREGRWLAAMEVDLAKSFGLSPQTYKAAYASPDSDMTGVLQAVLAELLDSVLGRFYRTAEKDSGDLLEIYGFVDRDGQPLWGAWMADRADAIARNAGYAGRHEFLQHGFSQNSHDWMDPAEFEGAWMRERPLRREIYPSVVHGDLNFANILFARRPAGSENRRPRIWVIDFAHLSRLPNLIDFAKLENDLSFILLPVADEDAYLRAAALNASRVAGHTLDASGLPALAQTDAEHRYASLVGTVRRIAAEIDGRGATAMDDYRLALLRYGAATLGYEGPTPLQRRLALLSCAHLSGLIRTACA